MLDNMHQKYNDTEELWNNNYSKVDNIRKLKELLDDEIIDESKPAQHSINSLFLYLECGLIAALTNVETDKVMYMTLLIVFWIYLCVYRS